MLPRRLHRFLFVTAHLLTPVLLSAKTLDEARELHLAGDYPAAITAYRNVAKNLEKEDPASAASALNNVCVLFNSLGEFEEARIECRRSLALRRLTDDQRRLARTLNNYALALQNLGDYSAARSNFGEALEINELREDVAAQVINLANLGALSTIEGHYGLALAYYGRVNALARSHLPESWAAEQLEIAIVNRGVVFERLGAYREALDLYSELITKDAEARDPRRRAQIMLNTGVIYRNLGDPVRAVEAFEGVAKTYRQLEDPDGLSNALLNLGLVFHLNLDEWDRAEDAYRSALAVATQYGDRPEEIQDLYSLGRFLLDRGRLDEAEEMFRRCLAASEESGSFEGLWSALAGLGSIANRRGDPEQALRYLERAAAEIERVGTAVRVAALRSGFFGATRPVFAAAVETLAELDRRRPGAGYAERALEVVQRAKARVLLDALGSPEARAQPLSAPDLQQRMEDRQIVEYFAGEKTLLRWIIRSDRIQMDNLGPVAPVRDYVRQVRRQLAHGRIPDSKVLVELSSTLLSGIDLDASRDLVLALDSSLYGLPFSLLPIPSSSDDTLLVDLTAVSYLPSASAQRWLEERREQRQLPSEVLAARGFGNPDVGALREQSSSAAGLLVSSYDLEPLNAAQSELEALVRLLPGDHELLTGERATETAFRSPEARPARIVHIASHALIDERPGRGAVLLLGSDNSHDGVLEPREIASVDRPALLTVLAACRTAPGPEDRSLLATLAGAFLASGSSGVLATLWDVGDEATAAFMAQFYYALGRGAEPAAALRTAKMRLRADSEWNRPHLWAGYVLIGDAQAFPAGARWSATAGFAAALLLVSTFVILWKRRRSHRSAG